MKRYAHISECERYRYRLDRDWSDSKPAPPEFDLFTRDRMVFVMLNPSTADAEQDDPTIRKCVGFCNRWGYKRLTVLNLFALRTSRPKVLSEAYELHKLGVGDDPQGPVNGLIVRQTLRSPDIAGVICAWGNLPDQRMEREALHMRACIKQHEFKLQCLGITRFKQPKHPSRIAYGDPVELAS